MMKKLSKFAGLAILIAAFAFIAAPYTVWADSVTLDGTVITANNTASLSITVGNNANRMGLVCYSTYQGGGPTGITWGGNAMTKVAERVGSFNEKASVWAIVAPATGATTVTVSGGGNWYGIGAYSLYGVDQNIPTNFTTGGGDSNSASLAITTLADNSWVIGCFEAEPVPTMSTSGGTSDYVLEGQPYQHGHGQHVLKATAGSQTMSASLSYGARWNVVDVEIKAATAAPATTVVPVAPLLSFN